MHSAVHSNTEDNLIGHKFWEYTNEEFVDIKSSLKHCIKFWEEALEPSSFVLNVIRDGYKLPFLSAPRPCCAKNNQSALRHGGFVEGAISALLRNKFVTELEQPARCCNPLTVAKKGKLRLVLDLRFINPHIELKKFRYENLKMVAELFDEDDYFITFDLTSGYHHIDIHPDYHAYLGFHWEFKSGKIRYFQFTVLPFGLCSAGYVFTKLLRPFVKRWRGKGMKAIVYLDDGVAAQKDKERAKLAGRIIESDLTSAGFFINRKKSNFEPVQSGKWLGVIIDTRKMSFTVPTEKIKKLKAEIEHTIDSPTCTPKLLARVAGQLAAMQVAIGPLVRLFTRSLYAQIAKSTSWYDYIRPSQKTVDEMRFWLRSIDDVNGYTFKPYPTTTQIVFTDASSSGYGGYTAHRLQKLICSGKFSYSESQQSSTFREILAVKLVLMSYGKLLKNQAIQINMDNYGATRVLQIGSSKDKLQELALEIFQYCLEYNIKLSPEWVPRDLNQEADALSKIQDSDSWGVDKDCFNYLNNLMGPFTVDRFADDRNAKLACFNSKFYCPGTAHVNAFTADWSYHNNWCSPPVNRIGSTIKHMARCKAMGTLLVPEWKSAYYWPILYPDGVSLAGFVKKAVFVTPYYYSCTPNSVFTGYVPFRTLALAISFFD